MEMENTTNNRVDKGRNTAVDSLRGIAAVFVVFHHSVEASSSVARSLQNPPIQDIDSASLWLLKILVTITSGHNAVLLFFVLSGFVLMLSMDRDKDRGDWSTVSFVLRRFMRLYPVLMAALVVCFALGALAVGLGSTASYFVTAADPVLVLQNMLLWNIGVHGATWTIQVEFLVIPFLLAGFWASRHFGLAGLVVCLSVSILEAQRPFFTEFSPALSGSLCAFYAGMLSAKLIGDRGSAAENGVAIILMAALYAFISLFAPLDSKVLLISQVLACAGLIVAVFTSRECFVTRILNGKHLVRLGRISYSLYLLNVPVMWLIFSVAPRFDFFSKHPVLSGLLIGVLTTLITIPIADLFERAIERPANALGKRLTTRSRPTVEAAAE